jgi:DNA-binding transcriptional LysR family regulator
VLHSCRAAGFEPRVAFGSDDYNAVQAFVAVGLGVAILPRLAASFRSAATASMLGVLKETADAFTVQDGRG